MSRLLCLLLGAGALYAEQKEYYCYKPEKDIYLFADTGEREDCKGAGGKFGSFPRKKFKWFCNQIDSGFMIGEKNTEAQAKELCGSGTLQKPK